MKLNERIRALRLKNNLTQQELSDKLGISVVSVRYWENGTKIPSTLAIVSLAKMLKVSTDYLLGIDTKQESQDAKILFPTEYTLINNYRLLDSHGKTVVETVCKLEKARIEAAKSAHNTGKIIPLHKSSPSRYIPKYLTPSAAGYSAPLDGEDFEMALVDEAVPSDADFAVRIQGDSMMPYIQDGDTVYVKKDSELAIGDVGIFAVDGAMYCKQYYIDPNGYTILVSANPELKNSNVCLSNDSASEVRCYGKVILGYKIDLPAYLFE